MTPAITLESALVSTAILLSCHGTVSDLDDVPAFLSNIRRGHPAPEELETEVRRRLEHIGGSPLMQITRDQASALGERLGLRAAVAARLWHPYPREVLAELVDSGVDRVISLPLAPQSVHVYHAAVREAAAAHPRLRVDEVEPYGLEPRLIDAFEETVDEALATLPEGARAGAAIVLSAHSLPLRVLSAGDPYEAQFREMAARLGERLARRGHPWRVAFQSQGATADPWLGPDLRETFAAVVAEGRRSVVVAPIGFLADHVETLYDLDVEATQVARAEGVYHYGRARAVGARASLIDALEVVARRALDARPRP
jgi:protoporphyrin/coproporphyrin ferrochelatase